MTYNFSLRVYYEDTDSAGVVYYANYLKFIERARSQILLDNNLNNTIIKSKFNLIFMVKSCKIDFINPSKLDDLLNISTSVIKKTKLRVNLLQRIFLKNNIVIEAKVELVSVNLIGKPVRMPLKLFDLF